MSIPPQSATRRLVALSWPLVGLNLLNVLALVVDTLLAGRLDDGGVALTAMGYAGQIGFLLIVAMLGLAVGSVALVARAHGGGDAERVKHLLVQAIQLTFGLAVVVGIVGALAAAPLLEALGATEAVRDTGAAFLRPLMLGTVGNFLTVLLGAVYRAVGNTRVPFVVSFATNVVNVGLNVVLMFGLGSMPGFGLVGAGYGTAFAQTFSALVLLAALGRGADPTLVVRYRPTRLDFPLVRELVRVGAPAALDMALLSVALLVVVGLLGHGESTESQYAVAAHGIGIRVQSLAFVPGMSISQAQAALVGQSLGARSIDGARSVLRASLLLTQVVLTSIGGLLVLAASPLVSLFGALPGTELSELAITWTRMLGAAMPLVALHFAYTGLLQGAGRTTTSLVINFVSSVLVMLPLSFVLGTTMGLGAFGVWLGFPLSYVVKALLGYLAYRRGGWAEVGVRAR